METTNHLHLHFNIARVVYRGFMYICDVAMELWGMVLCLFWNQWVMPKVLLICCLVGKDGLVDIVMQIDGMQFLCVLCGVFGGKVMPKVSKGVRNQFGLKALVLKVLI